MAALAVATVFSRAPVVSLLGNEGRLGGLVSVVPTIGLAWMIATAAGGRPDRQRALLRVLALSAGVGACYLWLQQADVDLTTWLEPWDQPPRHPPGTLGNSNFSGAHMALGSIAGAWLALHTRGSKRVAWAVATALTLSAVGVSQSRGAMLAALVGLTVLALAGNRRRTSRRIIIASVVPLVALVVAATILVGEGDLDELIDSDTLADRIDLWQVALNGWRDHPVVGGGPDLYRLPSGRRGRRLAPSTPDSARWRA